MERNVQQPEGPDSEDHGGSLDHEETQDLLGPEADVAPGNTEEKSPALQPNRDAVAPLPGSISPPPVARYASPAAAQTDFKVSTANGAGLENASEDVDPLLQMVLGKCMLQKQIGQGGMGSVYLGKHLTLDIEVAVKVLPKALAQQDRGFVDRFLREARMAARIHHPNIVQVLDVDFQQGYYFIVMEYVEGETAGQRLRRKKILSEREVVEIGLDMASALDYAARKKIIHRDIKPENILISIEGEVKIADLGLAKPAVGEDGSDLTLGNQIIGTPSYISPEQALSSRSVDHRSDLYSLGATLFHLATGRPPFLGTSAFDIMSKHQTQPAPALRAYRAELSLELAAIVKQLLNKDPDTRYQSAGELLLALRNRYEQMVPKQERDAILAGSNIRTEGAANIKPANTSQNIHHKSSVHLKAHSGESKKESSPATNGIRTAENAKAASPEARLSVPATDDRTQAPDSKTYASLRSDSLREESVVSSSYGISPVEKPSNLWVGFLVVPFINCLAFLWLGSVSEKREWFFGGLISLLIQSLFAALWEEPLARAGLGLIAIMSLLYGWSIRREYEHRVTEIRIHEQQDEV